MRILSNLIIISLFLVACKSKEVQTISNVEDIPDAPDIIFGKTPQETFFQEFVDTANMYYQARDTKALQTYLEQYSGKFTSQDEKNIISLLEAKRDISIKEYDQAKNKLSGLLSKVDKNLKGQVYFYLGEVSRIQKDYQKAIQQFQKAYIFYKSDEIQSSLADTYMQLKDYRKAIQIYKKVLKNNPNASEDSFLLGASYYENKQKKESFKMMQKVLQLNPKDVRAYEYLAKISEDQNKMRDYYYYYSRALLLKKDYKTTIQFLESVDLVYKDQDLSSILISSAVRLKDPKKAMEYYYRTVKTNPKLKKLPEFQIYYGILYIIPEKGKEAGKKYFSNLVHQFPDNFLVLSEYASLLEELNPKDTLLEQIYLKTLYIQPEDTINRYKLALYYQNQNKMALSQLEYGVLYYYQNQKDLSLEILLSIEKHFPKFTNIQLPLYIGLLYQEQGNKELALNYYTKAKQIDPKNPIVNLSIKTLADR